MQSGWTAWPSFDPARTSISAALLERIAWHKPPGNEEPATKEEDAFHGCGQGARPRAGTSALALGGAGASHPMRGASPWGAGGHAKTERGGRPAFAAMLVGRLPRRPLALQTRPPPSIVLPPRAFEGRLPARGPWRTAGSAMKGTSRPRPRVARRLDAPRENLPRPPSLPRRGCPKTTAATRPPSPVACRPPRRLQKCPQRARRCCRCQRPRRSPCACRCRLLPRPPDSRQRSLPAWPRPRRRPGRPPPSPKAQRRPAKRRRRDPAAR